MNTLSEEATETQVIDVEKTKVSDHDKWNWKPVTGHLHDHTLIMWQIDMLMRMAEIKNLGRD